MAKRRREYERDVKVSLRRFHEVRRRIQKERALQREDPEALSVSIQRALCTGDIREARMARALDELTQEGVILGYVQTTHGDMSHVRRGIDFFIIVPCRGIREVVPFQVCSASSAGKHRLRHPGNKIVAIDDRYTRDYHIKSQIRHQLNGNAP